MLYDYLQFLFVQRMSYYLSWSIDAAYEAQLARDKVTFHFPIFKGHLYNVYKEEEAESLALESWLLLYRTHSQVKTSLFKSKRRSWSSMAMF